MNEKLRKKIENYFLEQHLAGQHDAFIDMQEGINLMLEALLEMPSPVIMSGQIVNVESKPIIAITDGKMVMNEARQALCGACGEVVQSAYYDGKNQLQSVSGFMICGENNVAYHYEAVRDCWGKHTGYANFTRVQPLR